VSRGGRCNCFRFRVVRKRGARPSFSCSGHLNPTEIAICADDGLGDLDRAMASAYKGMLDSLPDNQRGDLIDVQRYWIAQRDSCGLDKACIRSAILARINALEGGAPPQPVPQPPQPAPASYLPRSGLSSGGVVREGPGTNYPQIGSLVLGEPITIVRDTGISMNNYNWFEISWHGGAAFHWGGIICSDGGSVPGIYQVCGPNGPP